MCFFVLAHFTDGSVLKARLSDVPNVEPPAPSDWEPRPVYPIHHIPYHVAQYWDRGLRQQVEEKKTNSCRRNHAAPEGKGRVPRDLRDTVKKTPGVVGWVRSLEEPVRQFLLERGVQAEVISESDVSDDEVVFVGRKSAPRAETWKKAHREVRDQQVDRGMIFDSLEDDESSAFKYVLPLWTLLQSMIKGSITGLNQMFLVLQAMAYSLHIRLLRTGLAIGHDGHSCPALCLHWHSRDRREEGPRHLR